MRGWRAEVGSVRILPPRADADFCLVLVSP